MGIFSGKAHVDQIFPYPNGIVFFIDFIFLQKFSITVFIFTVIICVE